MDDGDTSRTASATCRFWQEWVVRMLGEGGCVAWVIMVCGKYGYVVFRCSLNRWQLTSTVVVERISRLCFRPEAWGFGCTHAFSQGKIRYIKLDIKWQDRARHERQGVSCV